MVGTSTGGSNVLGNSTQVSLYFTSTSLRVAASATPTGAMSPGSETSNPTAGGHFGTSSRAIVGSSTMTASQPASTSNGASIRLKLSALFALVVFTGACVI